MNTVKGCFLVAKDAHGSATVTSAVTTRNERDSAKHDYIVQDFVNEKAASIYQLRKHAKEKPAT